MTYTVEDVDRLFGEGFDLKSRWNDYRWRVEGQEAWHAAKDGELDDLPTELGQLFYVDEHGGEGMGDQYWVVVKILAEDGSERFFKRNGWYQSYSGGELDGPTIEVRPREKMVTLYE